MHRYLEGKNILITGVCGSVGTELLKQIAFNSEFTPKSIVGIDNNETKLFELERLYVNNMKAQFYLLDIRNVGDLIQKTSDIDIIYKSFDKILGNFDDILKGNFSKIMNLLNKRSEKDGI